MTKRKNDESTYSPALLILLLVLLWLFAGSFLGSQSLKRSVPPKRFSKLIVEAKESHKWSLTEDFILYNRSVQPRWFELGLKGDLEVDEPFILVESGFITDFGTTPRLFWWFLSDSVLVEEPRGRQMSFFLLVFGAPTST